MGLGKDRRTDRSRLMISPGTFTVSPRAALFKKSSSVLRCPGTTRLITPTVNEPVHEPHLEELAAGLAFF